MNQSLENTPGSRSEELLIHELFEAQVKKTPDRIALEFGEKSFTYTELNERAQTLADHIIAHGADADKIIGLCVKRSENMVLCVLGILKSGAAYLPLEFSYPKQRLAFMLENSRADILVTDSATKDYLPQIKGTQIIFDQLEPLADKPESVLTTKSNHLAYVIFTSGSTGTPKGVAVEHRSFTNMLFSVARRMGIGENEIVLSVAPYSFDIALPDWSWALLFGGKLIFVEGAVYHDPAKMIEKINSTNPTHLQATPTFWQMLLADGSSWLPDIRLVSTGEPMGNKLREKLRKRSSRVWNLYGPTETTVWSSACYISEDTCPNSIGLPIDNTTIHIQNEEGYSAKTGEKGELLIGGIGLARGYLNDESSTKQYFRTVENLGPDRLYKTGDLVRQNESGTLDFFGRLDYQVKIRGFRIELGEIDAAIQNHPDIYSSVTVLLEENVADKKIITYVVKKSDSTAKYGDYREFLEQTLPQHMIPAGIEVLEKLPTNSNGKVDRSALPVPSMLRREVSTDYANPEETIQIELVKIWEEVLNFEGLGIDDNFFEVGGHSLTAMQIANRIREKYDAEINIAMIFGLPTVRMFSEQLKEQITTS